MAEEKLGVKETQEMLVGVLALAEVLGPVLKDGFQAGQDLPAILAALASNEDLKAKMAAAVEAADKVPAEVGDLDVAEIFQLVTVSLPQLLKVLDAWKK